jgi:hypothetical protein
VDGVATAIFSTLWSCDMSKDWKWLVDLSS